MFFLNSLSCLCSANSGPLDNNRRDCNQWWAILAEMFPTNSWQNVVVRDRPFNLKGGGGGYGFLFRSEKKFQTTQELEYYFFLLRKAWNFFPESNIRLYDKNSESDYFFFPPPKSEYFFQQHWESEYFFRKKTITPPPPPPPPLQVKWSFPYYGFKESVHFNNVWKMSVQISLEANDRSTVLGLSTTNNYNTCTCI